MIIDVLPPSPTDPESLATQFALQRDDWNDYSFQTYYHLYYKPRKDSALVKYIGGVKILRIGQTEKDAQLIREAFDQLGAEFCSVGASLDYYQRLNELPKKDRKAIMRALNDAVAHPGLVERFSAERGWTISVFRDNPGWRNFLNDARVMYEGNYAALSGIETQFSFLPDNSPDQLLFSFRSPETTTYGSFSLLHGRPNRNTVLPERLIVLVGRNGSGKSTMLARLAHLAFASPQERASGRLRAMGRLEPPSIGFTRIITVSYSAFDSFTVPGADARDKSQTSRDIEADSGRFVFCGLRDVVAEAQDDINLPLPLVPSSPDSPTFMHDRRRSTRLKPVELLADEFDRLIKLVLKNDRKDLLLGALQPLLSDPSFAELHEQIVDLLEDRAKELFLGWSTGHKIVLHVIVSLVAHARPRSLILFDEPEMHLHPPLTAALMHAVRRVLAETNALCVVATHSPVLLQETLAQHVRYISRTGSKLAIQTPRIETFGENIGILTNNTFGLTSSTTDYHRILDYLIKHYDSVEAIDELFTPGLSSQARAYVMSKFAARQSDS